MLEQEVKPTRLSAMVPSVRHVWCLALEPFRSGGMLRAVDVEDGVTSFLVGAIGGLVLIISREKADTHALGVADAEMSEPTLSS